LDNLGGLREAYAQTDLTDKDIAKLEEVAQATSMVEESFSSSVCISAKKLTYYTGLPNLQVFLLVLAEMNEYLDTIKIKKLSNFQKLLIVLMKLRLNLDYTDLSYRFNVRISSLSKLFKEVVIGLEHAFCDFIHWPDQKILRTMMPTEFKARFGDKVSVIIDCFEIRIQKPTMLNAQIYSLKKYVVRITRLRTPILHYSNLRGTQTPY
jgi:hypothetical protein